MPGMMRAGLLPTRGQLQDAGACHAISIIRVSQIWQQGRISKYLTG